MASFGRRLALWRVFLVHWAVAAAETFAFVEHAAPTSYSVSGWHLFHVYHKTDFTKSIGLSDSQVVSSSVEINVQALSTSIPTAGYFALEVALVYYQDYMAQFDQEHFCKDGHLTPMTGKPEVEWALAEIPLLPGSISPKKTKVALNKTGDYVLLLSNCGEFAQATVSGTVRVQNPYGYLPPEHYHSEGPLRVVLAAYCLLGALWLANGWYKREKILDVHLYLSGLLLWSIAEVAAKLYTLHAWNVDGDNEPWMSIAVVVYVLKWIYLYSLAVHVAGGWFDRDGVSVCIGGSWLALLTICSVYVVFLSMRESVLNQHEGLGLPVSTVVIFRVPVMLMDAALLTYIVLQTRQELDTSVALGNIDRSNMFGRLKSLAASCACSSCSAVFLDLARISGIYDFSWRSRWIPAEGAVHGICLVTLAVAMFVMRPGLVQKNNSYGKVAVEGVDTEPPVTLGRAEELDDDD